MTAVYHGRGEKMEGYELYRLSDEEIQHVGVKGMKWGKRKSRSAYMTAVDKHEAKTKANRQKVADHKAREKEQGKAVAKAVGKKYMGAVAKHEAKSKANNEKLAAHKAREKAEGKAAVKKYMDAVNAHEKKGQDVANAKSKEKSDKRAINAESKAKKQPSPEEQAAKTLKRKESLKKAGEIISYMSKFYVTASIEDQIRNEISDPTLQEYAKVGARAKIDEAWRVK